MKSQVERRLEALKEMGYMTIEFKGDIYELEYDGWGYISNGRVRSREFVQVLLKDGIIR